MGENSGRMLDVAVTKIAHGGVGVARHEGRVVFVSDAIPGERVLARVSDDSKRKFWRAETVQVLEASPHRREHVWPEASLERDPADRAGGAEFGHIELAHQRELKRQVLAEALQRMAGLEREFDVEAMPGDDTSAGTGWRTRVRLHADAEGRLGPFAARSHRVIPVASLPLAVPAVRSAAPLSERFPGEPGVEVLAPSATGEARLVVGAQAPTPVTEVVRGREFRVDDTGFWQVHRLAATTLFDAVRDAIDRELADPTAANLDLYAGVGLFAAAMAERLGVGTHVTSIEGDPRATGHAEHNLRQWPGATARTGRVERVLAELAANADAAERSRFERASVVLDPPRSGAGRQVVAALAQLRPAQLVYVACDPVALARDTDFLQDAGFEMTGLRVFDLFPNTHHLEAVASFARASRSPNRG